MLAQHSFSSAFLAPDIDQDGLLTENEFNSLMLAPSLPFGCHTLGAASDKFVHSAVSLIGINHDKYNNCLSDLEVVQHAPSAMRRSLTMAS